MGGPSNKLKKALPPGGVSSPSATATATATASAPTTVASGDATSIMARGRTDTIRSGGMSFEWVVPPSQVPPEPPTDGNEADLLPRTRSNSRNRNRFPRKPAMFSFRSRPKNVPEPPPPEPSYVLPAVRDNSPDSGLVGLGPYLIKEDRTENGKGERSKTVSTTSSPPSRAKIEQTSARGGFHKPSSFYGRALSPSDSNLPSLTARSSTINPLPRSTSGTSHPVRKAARSPPCFNVMVVGPPLTGKTSFLQTFLATRDLAGSSTSTTRSEAEEKVRDFARRGKGTKEVDSVSVGVKGGHRDRETVALTVVDTPALEAGADGLKAEMAVTKLLRLIEQRFDHTLVAESQVSRTPQRTGDTHIHLVIFFIDPASIVEPSGTDKIGGMSQVDLRLIGRLRKRTNVLPVIARADELTNARLSTIKSLVRRDLASAGYGFGVFLPRPALSTLSDGEEDEAEDGVGDDDEEESTVLPAEPDVQRRGPEVIVDAPEASERLTASAATKPPHRPPRSPSRSLHRQPSRRPAARPSLSTGFIDDASSSSSSSGDDDPNNPLEALLPFSLISPERVSLEKGEGKGRFVRSFRWGEVDVLNEKHCDFVVLKKAVLGSHMEKLKHSTRQLYEAYRTERLENRRRDSRAP